MIASPLLHSRSSGVTAKLRNAFLGIALFSVLAAIVAVITLNFIEAIQDEVLQRTAPAMQDAERLAKEAVTIIAATPVLIAASDHETLQSQSAQIKAARERIATLLAKLRQANIADHQLDRISEELSTMFDILTQQVLLVERRNELSEQTRRLAVILDGHIESIIQRLKPASIDRTAQILKQTDAIHDQLRRQTDDSDLLPLFEQVTGDGFYAIELLTDMQFRADELRSDIGKLMLTSQLEDVARLRDKTSLTLRSLTRGALELDGDDLRREVAQVLREIALLERGPESIFYLQSRLLQANQQQAALAKQNRVHEKLLGSHVDQLLAIVGDAIRASVNSARQAVLWGEAILIGLAVLAFFSALVVVWRFVLRDVAARVLALADTTRRLAAGELDVPVTVTGNDELAEMADAVRVFKANATELRRSNAELEQFAYVASHDLKAPLRGISNLASWIESDSHDQLSADSQQHLSLLRGRVARLEKLLDDLLKFSRAGRQKSEIRPIDLATALPELFALVAPPDRFKLIIDGQLPSLHTAAAPLEQVFRNLISNAVKHHDRQSGTITVSAKDLDTSYGFTVADDGPGIPPEFHEKIFGMFQTLRGRDEVEGSGMGLAIIKKLVETVSCEITVRSEPERLRGTTFYFTWPKEWPQSLSSNTVE